MKLRHEAPIVLVQKRQHFVKRPWMPIETHSKRGIFEEISLFFSGPRIQHLRGGGYRRGRIARLGLRSLPESGWCIGGGTETCDGDMSWLSWSRRLGDGRIDILQDAGQSVGQIAKFDAPDVEIRWLEVLRPDFLADRSRNLSLALAFTDL